MTGIDVSVFSKVDYWSLASIPIETYYDEQRLSHGTGFIYSFLEKMYLITAWHVFSGRHYQTGENLSRSGGRPNKLKIWWNQSDKPLNFKIPDVIAIWDEHDEPLWIEPPSDQGKIDIALLPIAPPRGAKAYPINELPQRWVEIGMGQDVFILGFPMISDPLKLPIWKRGSLASELIISPTIQPYYLIDTASRPGMSGSPVIARTYSHDLPLPPRHADPRHRGDMGNTVFLGVYSGRFTGKSMEDAQLGIVWPVNWIDSTIKHIVGEKVYQQESKNPFLRQSSSLM